MRSSKVFISRQYPYLKQHFRRPLIWDWGALTKIHSMPGSSDFFYRSLNAYRFFVFLSCSLIFGPRNPKNVLRCLWTLLNHWHCVLADSEFLNSISVYWCFCGLFLVPTALSLKWRPILQISESETSWYMQSWMLSASRMIDYYALDRLNVPSSLQTIAFCIASSY